MSDSSANLNLPYIQPAQAQKHVTHNEALRILDALVQLTVVSASTQTAPASPAPGSRYVIPTGATGIWSARIGQLASFEDGGWIYYPPVTGWTAWVTDTSEHITFDATTWVASAQPDFQNLEGLGIGASSDVTNPFVVSGDATLLSHAGAGHQLKLNKATPGDTASLLFQTGFSGRAEMGLAGSDDFEIKVSADGSTFHQSIVADPSTGVVEFPSGVSGLTPDAFGNSPVVTTSYVISRGLDLVTNGTGLLGNGYNYPSVFDYDPVITPNLPASFAYSGYSAGLPTMAEALPLDPNRCYRLSSYLWQEGLPGDWSAFPHAERHAHYMGLLFLDADGATILPHHHMRYRQNGTDSKTTLAAPLAPGDTTLQLTDATGWNDTNAQSSRRGIIVFGYRGAGGNLYRDYSRLVAFDLFDLAGVNKATNTITLKVPFPAALANPDDPSGIWPAGTELANSSNGAIYKYSFYSNYRIPQVDRWFHTNSYIGGIDRSGTNVTHNFPPGVAAARIMWLPNYTNQSGGSGSNPDTGNAHRVWFAGASVQLEPLAVMQTEATGPSAGRKNIKVPTANFDTGVITLQSSLFTAHPV